MDKPTPMTTLLVIGSKPDPVVPPLGLIDAVACANASGRSALRLGLPDPAFTVLSSIVLSGKNPSNRISLQALSGLSTGALYIYPRPPYATRPLKRLLHLPATLRTTRPLVELILNRKRYRYKRIIHNPLSYYTGIVLELCGNDPEVDSRIHRKVPSSGVIAIALGLNDRRYRRVIVSGFSFEITHAYAENPDIAERGSAASLHAQTDIAILAKLAQRCDRLFTAEPIVHERTALPLIG